MDTNGEAPRPGLKDAASDDREGADLNAQGPRKSRRPSRLRRIGVAGAALLTVGVAGFGLGRATAPSPDTGNKPAGIELRHTPPSSESAAEKSYAAELAADLRKLGLQQEAEGLVTADKSIREISGSVLNTLQGLPVADLTLQGGGNVKELLSAIQGMGMKGLKEHFYSTVASGIVYSHVNLGDGGAFAFPNLDVKQSYKKDPDGRDIRVTEVSFTVDAKSSLLSDPGTGQAIFAPGENEQTDSPLGQFAQKMGANDSGTASQYPNADGTTFSPSVDYKASYGGFTVVNDGFVDLTTESQVDPAALPNIATLNAPDSDQGVIASLTDTLAWLGGGQVSDSAISALQFPHLNASDAAAAVKMLGQINNNNQNSTGNNASLVQEAYLATTTNTNS